MIGEFNVYGVFVPPLLVWVAVALPLTAALRRALRWCGFYHIIWHRPLVDFALLVIVLGAVVAVTANWGPQ